MTWLLLSRNQFLGGRYRVIYWILQKAVLSCQIELLHYSLFKKFFFFLAKCIIEISMPASSSSSNIEDHVVGIFWWMITREPMHNLVASASNPGVISLLRGVEDELQSTRDPRHLFLFSPTLWWCFKVVGPMRVLLISIFARTQESLLINDRGVFFFQWSLIWV